MHEYSIVQALLEKVDREARAHDAVFVKRLSVRIGELSGVEIDLLKTAFDLFRGETVCSGADLEIVPVPVLWSCPTCGFTAKTGDVLRCVPCGVPLQLSGGDEIILDQIEMETSDV